jgi:hypothetical protein
MYAHSLLNIQQCSGRLSEKFKPAGTSLRMAALGRDAASLQFFAIISEELNGFADE